MKEQQTAKHYEVLTVPEGAAANCVYVRGPSKVDYLLHPPTEECPESVPVSEQWSLGYFIKQYFFIFTLLCLWQIHCHQKVFIPLDLFHILLLQSEFKID